MLEGCDMVKMLLIYLYHCGITAFITSRMLIGPNAQILSSFNSGHLFLSLSPSLSRVHFSSMSTCSFLSPSVLCALSPHVVTKAYRAVSYAR
jgi:hypothetical protein